MLQDGQILVHKFPAAQRTPTSGPLKENTLYIMTVCLGPKLSAVLFQPTSSLQNRFQADLSTCGNQSEVTTSSIKPVISRLDRSTEKKAKADTSWELSERLCNYTQPLGCHPTGLQRAGRRRHEAWLGGHSPRQSSGLVAVPSNTGLLP